MFFISLSKEIEADCVSVKKAFKVLRKLFKTLRNSGQLMTMMTTSASTGTVPSAELSLLSPCLTRPFGCVYPPEDESGGESRAAHADRRFLLSVCAVVSVSHLSDRHRGEEQGAQRQDL